MGATSATGRTTYERPVSRQGEAERRRYDSGRSRADTRHHRGRREEACGTAQIGGRAHARWPAPRVPWARHDYDRHGTRPTATVARRAVEEEQELDTERARREMAETTLREGMDEERQRREEAEQERDNLRRELYALRDLREPPQTVEEEPERPEPHPATGGAQEATQRPWWRRVFG